MSYKTMKLAFKEDAPEEVKNGVTISFGMEYSRLFKQSDEPFQVDRKIGAAILRSYDFFKEFQELVENVPTLAELMNDNSRGELNDLAVKTYGIKDAPEMPNKQAVAEAILKAVKSLAKEISAESEQPPIEIDPNKVETETVEAEETADAETENLSEKQE